mgnify:CR=1 FL=1
MIYFVGAGSGDPELITVKGKRLLESADTVLYTGSLVPKEVLSWCRDDALIVSSEEMDYDEILRATHTMKGIASNLEFTQLQQKSAKAVDMIRAGEKETVLPVIDEIEKEYQKVIEQIQKLD